MGPFFLLFLLLFFLVYWSFALYGFVNPHMSALYSSIFFPFVFSWYTGAAPDERLVFALPQLQDAVLGCIREHT